MSFSSPLFLLLLALIPVGVWRLRPATPRYWALALVRAGLWSALVLALAGAQAVQNSVRVATVFVLDASDSLSAQQRSAQWDYVRQAIASKASDDLWGVVVYGAGTAIEVSLNADDTLAVSPSAQVAAGDTDIEAALNTALALLPSDSAGRIVLMGDGIPTQGDALRSAQRARATGVQISVVPFASDTAPDVRVSALNVPPQVAEGQSYPLEVSLQADSATRGTLQLYANSALVYEAPVNLRAGENRFSLAQTAEQGGFQALEARFVPANRGALDRTTQNNRLAAFTQVLGAQRVLLLSSDADTGPPALEAALNAAGFTLERLRPEQIASNPAELANYASVILANVPASAFSQRQMLSLQSYVRDLGGGLLMIGGDASFAVGGYDDTPLAELAPLEMRLRDRQRLPRLTVAYVIDRSGSMSAPDPDGRFTNLQLAQQAILLSVELLQPDDFVGVVGFDSSAEIVVPFQFAEDIDLIQERVASLQPGGGTSILAGLNSAEAPLIAQDSENKHLILLTDGGTNDRFLLERVQTLRDKGVTLSVIGIGTDQPGLLVQMAQIGEGNYHSVVDTRQLPRIFAQETAFASRAYIVEGDIAPVLSSRHPILQDLNSLPNLAGYVASMPKDSASVLLTSGAPHDDPLLAAWQVGLGRVVAFTSDAGERWTSAWTTWASAPQLWGQMLAWTITRQSADWQSQVSYADGRAKLSVDAINADGAFVDDLRLNAQVVYPDGTSQSLSLNQSASGRYEASFSPTDEGAYFIVIQDPDNGTRALEGWAHRYSAEYDAQAPSTSLLAELAQVTGGRDLSAEPSAAFLRDLPPRQARAPLFEGLLALAILLLPVDVALRRLVISRAEWRALWARLLSRSSRPQTPSSQMDALRSAKQRAQSPEAPRPVSLKSVPPVSSVDSSTTLPPSASDTPAPTPPSVPAPSANDTVGALLKRRQARQHASDEADAPKS